MPEQPVRIKTDHFFMRWPTGLYETLRVDAMPTRIERIGEGEHAFDLQHYKRRVEVSVSPSGRSVRVWVDGVEVK